MVKSTTSGRSRSRVLLAGVLAAALVAVPLADARRWFWQNTHQRITHEALLGASNLAPFLEQLGFEGEELSGAYASLANFVPGVSIGDPTSAAGAILAGAVLEDGVENDAGHALAGTFDWKRPQNHFENRLGTALTAGAVPLFNHAASRWGDDVVANAFNWKVAQESVRSAVAGSTADERRAALEVALVALGCNLHLLQDMFQPSHTRNDAHPGHELFLGETFAGHSELEYRAKDAFTPFSGASPWSVPPPKRLPERDLYFRKAIEFSYDHFFSDDTEFVEPLPAVGTDVYEDLQTVSCPAASPEEVRYARSHSQHPPGGANAHLARRKSWCIHAALPGENHQCWDLTDLPCAATERVLDDNLSILIPQSIAYSTGLIDHFFRGRMEFAQSAGGALTITNASHEVNAPGMLIDVDFRQDPIEVPAEFVFLWEDADGKRTEFHRRKLPAGGLPRGESFTIEGFGGLLPAGALGSGSTRIACLLERAWVGSDPLAVGGVFTWTTCSQICREQPMKLTPVFDVTGDGADDLALWILNDETTGDPPLESLTILSGTNCQPVWSLVGSEPADLYAARVVGVRDVTGDGRGDVVVQKSADVQNQIFTFELRSGAGGGLVTTFLAGEFGELLPLGDVGGDGIHDFLIRGQSASVHRGTGAFLHTLFGVQASEVVTLAPDLDGDGGLDLMVEGLLGAFRVVSTQSGAVLKQGSFAGMKEVVALDDVNGDGVSDFAANDGPTQTLRVFSGKNGALLWSVPGLASDIASAGDADGDGHVDVSVRSLMVQTEPPSLSWKVGVASPKKKKVLLSFQVQDTSVVGHPFRVGDLNDDGREDLAFGFLKPDGMTNCFVLIPGVAP